MDKVFVVVKHEFPNEECASKWLMQLVSENVLCNGFDATITSRYNSNGNVEMRAELLKGEEKVIIYTEQKTIFKEV